MPGNESALYSMPLYLVGKIEAGQDIQDNIYSCFLTGLYYKTLFLPHDQNHTSFCYV